jgi:hypothetical protein
VYHLFYAISKGLSKASTDGRQARHRRLIREQHAVIDQNYYPVCIFVLKKLNNRLTTDNLFYAINGLRKYRKTTEDFFHYQPQFVFHQSSSSYAIARGCIYAGFLPVAGEQFARVNGLCQLPSTRQRHWLRN